MYYNYVFKPIISFDDGPFFIGLCICLNFYLYFQARRRNTISLENLDIGVNGFIFVRKSVHFMCANIKTMIVISPTELRANQKMYLDLAEKEQVLVKKGKNLIELVVRPRVITDEDVKHGISGEEVKIQVHNHIDELFAK